MKKLLLLLFLALSIPSFSQEEEEVVFDFSNAFKDSHQEVGPSEEEEEEEEESFSFSFEEFDGTAPVDLKYVPNEEKQAYGFEQEPMIGGTAYRIVESYLRDVPLTTIESERQEKILENFFWARGLKERDEDFAITLGRRISRIYDVVSWVAGLILIYVLMKNRIRKVIKASVNFPKDRTRKVIKAVANFYEEDKKFINRVIIVSIAVIIILSLLSL